MKDEEESKINQSVKLPNQEQKIAIEHSGGKILSAGAGSGKTFVLIEHIVFILKAFKNGCPQSEWEINVPTKLQRIVLMTFTVKAAGEMSSRMALKIDENIRIAKCKEDDADLLFWSIVKKNLVYLKMTTISSFCLTILKNEIKPIELPVVELVSQIEFKAKVTELFSQWFEQNQLKLPHLIQSSAEDLIDSLLNIFSSPEMRLTWNQQLKIADVKEGLNLFINESLICFTKKSWTGIDLTVDKKEQSKAWYHFLQSFENLRSGEGIISADNYKKYADWARGIERSPAEKYVPENFKAALSFAKDVRGWILDCEEHLSAFEDENETFNYWSTTFKSLFNFVEERYLSIPGLIFSDLEYYTYRALQEEENVKKLEENYDYFIVDEFQDTSRVQFEIIKKITAGNANKFFCVGDKKQAIYGFRGGELQVFSECVDELGNENEIILKNNFRSLKKIVNFNNLFFSYLFPLGLEYSGIDPHAIAMEEQVPSKQSSEVGQVYSLMAQIVNNSDEKPDSIDAIEAKVIYDEIKKNLLAENINTICILYRKLGPSEHLINLFDESFDYEVQIKVQMKEDPIVALFLLALELRISRQDHVKKNRIIFLMKLTAKSIGAQELGEGLLDQYLENSIIMPQIIAFENLLATMGISNSLYKENVILFHSISKICSGDTNKIYSLVYSELDQTFSYYIRTGISNKKVMIMTAHASKGLEFDFVIIGGAHTNGSYRRLDKIVGKWPNSFKWKSKLNQKKFHKSPSYLLESQIGVSKDFSEAKRLLYVVCTRAIKKLCWVDLNCIIKDKKIDLSVSANSWINILRSAGTLDCYEQIHYGDIDLACISHEKVSPSLVMRDFLGLNPKSHGMSVGLMVETSVTRLSILANCPFKFYLREICKLEPTQNEFVLSQSLVTNEEEHEEENAEGSEGVFYSSKARGTKIHLDLFNFLSSNDMNNLDNDTLPDDLIWAKNEIMKLLGKDSKIILEKQIKFQFFGHMVSGTPDVCIINRDELIIVDYKTGSLDLESQESYWFQVYCYAYAMIKTKQFDPEKKITLILMYVDQEKCLLKSLTYSEILDFLYDHWRKTECLTQVNVNHCPKCEYSNFCQFAKV